uniref:G_PROTEIN_RECEP_F1_2 domain-containing protein n=1 Tax=Caenorhabditis tropicalis TaxID=1561998 RepID=A0A1I7V2E6_9PELO
MAMSNLIRSLSDATFNYKPYIAFVAIIINIFHLAVLSRKSICSNSVNVIMIAIAVSDILNVSFFIFDKLVPVDFGKSDCSSDSNTSLIIGVSVYSAREILRRLSSWLDVLLAFVRYLIIKNPLNPSFKKVSRPLFGLVTVIISLVISTTISMLYWTQVSIAEATPWAPDNECATTAPPQTPQNAYISIQILYVVDGFLRIMPSTVLPILAFLLIRELRHAAMTRRKMSFTMTKEENSDADHTTKIVILMTISCMTAQVPLGIVYIVQGIDTSAEFQAIATNLISMFGIFIALNATSHPFICLSVSSQYRKTVKEVFICGKCKPKVDVEAVGDNKHSF